MKEERYHIALDDYEHGVVIRALNDTKTDLMKGKKAIVEKWELKKPTK